MLQISLDFKAHSLKHTVIYGISESMLNHELDCRPFRTLRNITQSALGSAQALFDQLDRNRDGVLSREEFLRIQVRSQVQPGFAYGIYGGRGRE